MLKITFNSDQAPPRPPLPQDGVPLRPPPPETDDEDEVFKTAPLPSQPIMVSSNINILKVFLREKPK